MAARAFDGSWDQCSRSRKTHITESVFTTNRARSRSETHYDGGREGSLTRTPSGSGVLMMSFRPAPDGCVRSSLHPRKPSVSLPNGRGWRNGLSRRGDNQGRRLGIWPPAAESPKAAMRSFIRPRCIKRLLSSSDAEWPLPGAYGGRWRAFRVSRPLPSPPRDLRTRPQGFVPRAGFPAPARPKRRLVPPPVRRCACADPASPWPICPQ